MFPDAALRSCDDCERYMYKDTRDAIVNEVNLLRSGEKQRRVEGQPTPCHICPKIPSRARFERRVSRKDAIEPSQRSRDAYAHYRMCKATGRFPDDPIVLANAAIIASVEQSVESAKMDGATELINLLFRSNK